VSVTPPADPGTPAVQLDAALLRYPDGTTVGPFDLAVPAAGAYGLVGSNGAGKTTLLKLVCGLLEPSSGSVEVWGEPVRGARPPLLGGLIEEPRFYPWLDAVANLRAAAAGRPDWDERVMPMLDLVGLAERARDPVSSFSQGMRQRLGLARSLLGDPHLLVLDEPTNGFDPEGIRWMRDLLGSQVEAGRTVLLSSHLLGEVQQVCESIAVLAGGRLLQSGRVEDIAPRNMTLEELYFELVEA
jgi:ABC-2 type transport system ATP-binding protein